MEYMCDVCMFFSKRFGVTGRLNSLKYHHLHPNAKLQPLDSPAFVHLQYASSSFQSHDSQLHFKLPKIYTVKAMLL